MKVFLFLLALATLFTFAAPNAISEGANMILNLSCNMNTKMTALEGLICYVQEHESFLFRFSDVLVSNESGAHRIVRIPNAVDIRGTLDDRVFLCITESTFTNYPIRFSYRLLDVATGSLEKLPEKLEEVSCSDETAQLWAISNVVFIIKEESVSYYDNDEDSIKQVFLSPEYIEITHTNLIIKSKQSYYCIYVINEHPNIQMLTDDKPLSCTMIPDTPNMLYIRPRDNSADLYIMNCISGEERLVGERVGPINTKIIYQIDEDAKHIYYIYTMFENESTKYYIKRCSIESGISDSMFDIVFDNNECITEIMIRCNRLIYYTNHHRLYWRDAAWKDHCTSDQW